MKILAVDDDSFVRDMLVHIIESWGLATLSTVGSAERAVSVISREEPPFDCLLIDMRMFGISGEELCSWVRTIPAYKDTPIFMVTALLDKQKINAAFLAGASDYITKPISPADIISRLNQVSRRLNKNALQSTAEGQGAKTDRFDFNKPRLIGGVHGEIEIDAMEKYLIKTLGSSADSLQVFSFVIKDAARLHEICDEKVFISLLQITGMAISGCLSQYQFFISNAGYGAFVGVLDVSQVASTFWSDLEAQVQAKLSDVKVSLSEDVSLGVVPYMSQPQALNMWSGRHAADILYRSIGDAESRCGPLSFAAAK